MNAAKILGLIRHLLTFAGGYLVAQGKIDEPTATEIVGGLMAVIGGVWSSVTPEKQNK